MPFEVFLMPTTASPAAAQVQVEVRRAITVGGGAVDPDGAGAQTADGIRVSLASGADLFVIDRLSPDLCRVIFTAALKTNSIIVRAGGADSTPLRVKGARGVMRNFPMRTSLISSPQGLCAKLKGDLMAWNRFVRGEQVEGVLGPNQEFLEPPASPGTEPRLATDPSGVAAQCVTSANPLTGKAQWTIERTVVSQNPQYGVVWRADVVTPDHPLVSSRLVCWRLPSARGDGKIMFEVRPLEMFDPSQSVGPLEAEPAPNDAAR